MSCPTCGAATQPGQRFCKDCGFALVADARPGLPPPGALRWNDDPDARAAAIVPTAPSAPASPPASPPTSPPTSPVPITNGAHPPSPSPPGRVSSPQPNSPQVTAVTASSWATAPAAVRAPATDWSSINIIEQTPSTTYAVHAPAASQPTASQPTTSQPTTSQPTTPPVTMTWRPAAAEPWPTPAAGAWLTDGVPNRIPLTVLGALALVLGVIASTVTVGSFTLSNGTTTRFTVHDVASNSMWAMIVVGVVFVVGAVLGLLGQRLGAGIAGGAAAALVGLVAVDAARVVDRLHRAQQAVTDGGSVTVTWEAGFFVLLAAGAIGVVAMFLSFAAGADDGRPRLHPAFCIVGALGTIAIAIGPTVPGRGLHWTDNIDTSLFPAAFVGLRLGSLALVAVIGVAGFATRRRWGAAAAVGAIAAVVVEWVGTLRTPVDPTRLGVGIVNLSSTNGTPNVLVTIGIVVTVLAAVAAVVIGAIGHRGPPPP